MKSVRFAISALVLISLAPLAAVADGDANSVEKVEKIVKALPFRTDAPPATSPSKQDQAKHLAEVRARADFVLDRLPPPPPLPAPDDGGVAR